MDKLTLIKANGGLGNRILCAASGILYSRAAGRDFMVDWRDGAYEETGVDSFSGLFDCPSARPLSELPRTDDVFPAVWRGNVDESVSEMITRYYPGRFSSPTIHQKLSLDARRLDYGQSLVVFWNYMHRIQQLKRHFRDAIPELAGKTVSQALAQAIKEYLPCAADVRSRVEAFKRGHFSGPVIGVHIRYTDLKTNLSLYEKALRGALASEPEATVFLCTDNAGVLERFGAAFPRVIATPKWYPDGLNSMHQNPACADRLENGKDALADIMLLAACDRLVYSSRSTFSQISRIISGLPADRVVDLDRFNPSLRLRRAVRDLIP